MAEIAAAVVGTGFIGVVHVEALRRLGVPVAGVVGSSPERARAKAGPLGLAGLRQLSRSCWPTRASTSSTSPRRTTCISRRSKAAIAAGKHVVCEKPLAMNAAESAELLRLAEARGVVHAVNFNIRFYPLCQQARAMVAAGELGEPLIVTRLLPAGLAAAADRLELAAGAGAGRRHARRRRHRLALARPADASSPGQRVEAVWPTSHTFLPVRQKPTRPVETFAGKDTRRRRPPRRGAPDRDRGLRQHPAALRDGARGVLTVSQVSAGRKNRLALRDRRRARRARLGLGAARGALDRPPRRAQRARCCAIPRCWRPRPRHDRLSRRARRGLPRHLQAALPSRLPRDRRPGRRRHSPTTRPLPTGTGAACRRGDRPQRAGGRWVDGRRVSSR